MACRQPVASVLGIDRFTMLFTEQDNIREVLLFPTMKDEK
jgi:lysyl-tRNA synthetase class II